MARPWTRAWATLRRAVGQDSPGGGPRYFHALSDFLVGKPFEVGQPHGLDFVMTQLHFIQIAQRHPWGLKYTTSGQWPMRRGFMGRGMKIFLCNSNQIVL